MSTRTFITTVKTILAPLAGVADSFILAEVNVYDKKDNLNFPAVNLTIEDGLEIAREDSAHNERTTTVTMRLIFPNTDGEEAELARLDVLDGVLNQFDKEDNIDTLNGVQDIWELSDIARFEADLPEPCIGFELKIVGRNAVQFT